MSMSDFTLDCMARCRKGIGSKNARDLREVTSLCTSKLAVDEQPIHFTLALLSYVLAKLIQKPRYRTPQLFAKVLHYFAKSEEQVRKNRLKEAQQSLESALSAVGILEKKDPRFVYNIVEKGRTKIAALLYAQGLSLARAVSLTGAQKHEVLEYSGKTVMADRFGKSISVDERLKYARKILK